jgi:hypothetical protein
VNPISTVIRQGVAELPIYLGQRDDMSDVQTRYDGMENQDWHTVEADRRVKHVVHLSLCRREAPSFE